MSVSRRILLGFGLVITLLAGIGGVAYVATLQISTVFEGFRKSADQSLYSSDLSAQVLKKQAALSAFQRDPSDEAAEALRADIATLLTATDRAAALFADAPTIAADLAALAPKISAFRDSFDRVAALEAEKAAERAAIAEQTDAIRTAINGLVFTANISGDPNAARDVARGKEVFLDARYAASLFTTDASAARFDAAKATLREARSVFETLASRASGGLQTSAEGVMTSLDAWGESFVRYRAATDGQRAELTERMEPIAASLVAGFDAATAAVAGRQGDLGRIGAAQVQSTQLSLVIGVAAALAIGVALALWIGRTISSALGQMASTMRRLAEADLDVDIQGDAHQHELGAMARALLVFRDNALEMRRMTQERAEAEARAEADRRAMMAELQEAFGVTVDAAVAGDFSRRVSAEFPDAELTALAAGVNRLLDTVESGLGEVSSVMGAVADGRLDARVSGERQGAFAALAESVNQTVDHLAGLVAELQTVSASIEEGSTDIARSALDLSARAESQASSLEETAATMEEMSATIKANADNAAIATDLAQNASQSADHGGQVVSETVSAMAKIESSSGRIADIIGVIDGIAFQTNLLALNAAVEAARAGDAGKGFAVVAQEVRTLAQRCAEAAQDVKGVIGESADHVSEGARLAHDAGSALAKITEAIRAVSQSVADISAASREQASGVEEMTVALNQMDEMTQRNSAMAEGSASAARHLSSEAGTLQSLVGHFGQGGAAAADTDPQAEAA